MVESGREDLPDRTAAISLGCPKVACPLPAQELLIALSNVEQPDVLPLKLGTSSPRVHDGAVYALDSGRGEIVRIDPESGERAMVAFCPGFLRGLSIHAGHALVTVSKPRNGTFAGLALDEALRSRDAEPWCGILIVNLASGDIVEWVKLEGFISELFDVVVMPGVVCPMAIGPDTIEARSTISFDPLL